MWLQVFLLFAGVCYGKMYEYEVLTSNLFDNLQADPALLVENELTDTSKHFIETQIDNYIKLVTHQETNTNKKKRSLLDQFTKNIKGFYQLSGVTPSATIPVRFPSDINLFQQKSQWYAASLESPEIDEDANYVVIFKLTNQTFVEEARVSIVNGVKLATLNLANSTLIAIAENDGPKESFHNKSAIYQFDKSGLNKIQFIDMHYASDIAMWRIHDDVYMTIAQFMSNKSGSFQYELEIPVYKWLGNHFDVVQSIESKGAKKVTPFTIDHVNFLAIGNFKDNKGNSRVYSEIYKYDYHLEKYVLYQRILTRSCTDIEVFTLAQSDHWKDTFLVVANSQEEDSEGGINYETDSIIYKFVDNYFIPFQSLQLNGVVQWLPVEGPNDTFVLIASCRFDGLKYFQYDGWAFTETPQRTTDLLKGSGIEFMRFLNFNNTSSLIISNKNNRGKVANIFELEFTHQTTLNEIYTEMSNWCDNGLKKIDELVNGELFDSILGEAKRADIDEDAEDAQFEALNSQLDSLLNQLNNVFEKPNEITADEIIFNNTTLIHNLNTTKLNNVQTKDLLQNTLNIDEGFEFGEISFDSVIVDGALKAQAVNTKDSDTLIHRSDNLTLTNVEVRGHLLVPKGVQIKGKLNQVLISNQNILLRTGDQNFSQPLSINNVKIDKMVAKALNNQNLTNVQTPIYIDYLETLKVKNLTIGGFINDVDIPTLDKYALKTSGDQIITYLIIVDEIQGKNLEIFGNINGRKVSDLIPINSGSYSINNDLIFKNDLLIDNLQVSESLNGIEVTNGKLDILLKNHTEEQAITGIKIFDDVNIYHAINFQGHVNSKNLEKMNPLITIEDDLVLQGPKTISGSVEIENFVSVKDVMTPDGTYSLALLEAEGLKLDSKEIKPHLYFVQQLNVDEIFVDTINGKEPNDFIVTGTDETQIVQGKKTFLRDIRITGATNANKINNVDIEELENKVMKVDGDQVIVGKHYIKHVIADRISTNSTTILNQSVSENVTIESDFKGKEMKTKAVTVRGLVNNLKFDYIVNDTVKKDTDGFIGGHKYFNTLTVGNLHAENGVTINENFDKINKLTFEESLQLDEMKIDNVYFENEFNGIDRGSFGKSDDSTDTIIKENQTFGTVTIYGNAYIASNKLNHVDITNLMENSVKLDEPFEFNSITFEKQVVSKSPVNLDGHIENFDFENVILPSDSETEIFGEKIFTNLTINGSAHFNGFINEINATEFCKFSVGEIDTKNVTINGNVFFVKGPHLGKINDVVVEDIKNRAWFGNKETNLTGSFQFEDIVFENDIHVGGYVDNISINLLYENYFSKTKNQNITATFDFENDLIFENLTVSTITSSGEVNGINLNEFVGSALLDDYDQMFESVVFLENCYIGNLTGDFLVNNLDLNLDVMRYDKVNMVTGTKVFQNLNVNYLKLEKNIKIQDVDVLEWFKNSVLKSTGFNIIGNKSFKNAVFANGFQVSGTLNGQNFDTDNIMMTDIPQDIIGEKVIYSTQLKPVVFKGIKLKGLLNGVDVTELVNNQAYKNQDNVFKTSVGLYNNITANNLVIKKTYGGVNITELISNVTTLGVLNNLSEQYQKLLDMSYKLEESIKEQAYFVHHYKTIQIIPLVTNSKKILGADGVLRIGSLVNDDTSLRMDLYSWHYEKQQFLFDGIIKFNDYPDYVDQVFSGQYLYMEANATGIFALMSNPILDHTITVHTNITRSTTSFVLPNTGSNCTLFAYVNCAPKIYCEARGLVELMQTLEPSNILRATSILINGNLYLITITEPTDGLEPHIDIWCLTNETQYFELHQSVFEAEPRSIAVVSYNFYFLAVASGHLQNTIHSGRVEIMRFDEQSSLFTPWQTLNLDAPTQVEFSVLPSKELVLYVVTDNPTEPLLVFRYEGIAGFKLNVAGSTLPKILYLNQFMGGAGQHFIVAQSYDEINVIQAVFKGDKAADG